MTLKYFVTLDYHDYEFDNACDAMTFAKLGLQGGEKRVIITMDAEREETTDEEDEEDEETED